MGMALSWGEDRDSSVCDLSIGYGSYAGLVDEICDRVGAYDERIYKLRSPEILYDGEGEEKQYSGQKWSKEDARAIYESMDEIKFLCTFPKKFRKWIINGAVAGDRPDGIDDDEMLWARFRYVRDIFSHGTPVYGG